MNELGHVSVHGDLNAHLTQMFKNLQGRVETLGNLTLSDNNTRALTLTNTGELYSAQNTVMLGKRFENTGGVQSDNDVTLTASTLTQSGTLLAGHDLTIEGEKLKNTGVIQTGHDLTLSLENDYRVSVPLKAGHDLTLNTAGNVYTYSSLEAGHDIGVQTHRMKVEAEGQVSAGNNVELHVTNGLSNRGLINSQGLTSIDAGTQVFNVGTGRIYGDHVAIKTTDLMNREETVNGTTTAASIVARDRLDIAAAKVVNREHALLASEGELYIGRHMNAAHWASGQADKVDNGSATIESGANMDVSAPFICLRKI